MAPGLELATYGVIFLGVAGVTVFAANQVQRTQEQRRRLEVHIPETARDSVLLTRREPTNPFLSWVQAQTSIKDSLEMKKLRRELSQAGFEHPLAPIWFVIARFGLAIGLPLGFLVLRVAMGLPMSSGAIIFWSLLLCAVGFLAPRSVLDRRVGWRRQVLEFEFPDALDLMVVCVEAGLSLDAAFVRVAHEVEHSHPRVAEEFNNISEQLRAGRNRAETLRDFGDRTGVAFVRSFAALVIQTESLGTSIAQTLRTYSTEMRDTRFLKAEEKALRIPVLMTVPLVACILPVIVVSLMLPAAIDVIRVLIPALSGGHHGGHP